MAKALSLVPLAEICRATEQGMHERLNYWQARCEYGTNGICINRRISSVRIVYTTKVTRDSQNVFEVSSQSESVDDIEEGKDLARRYASAYLQRVAGSERPPLNGKKSRSV
jgi:hypothetical protein